MDNKRIIKICDECESEYFSDTSKMVSLCPNSSYHLYGYKNCQHIFKEGRCVNCYIDENIFLEKEKTIWK